MDDLCLYDPPHPPALKKTCLLLNTTYKRFETAQLPPPREDLSFMGCLCCKFNLSKKLACPYCTIEHLVTIFVLYIEVCYI